MIRPFVRYPHPCLATPAAAVCAVTDGHRAIDLIETMEAAIGPSGGCVGLAAPQVGVMLRLVVVDASAERGQAVRLADPVIVAVSDEMREHVEASPNIPGISARLKRPARVTVRYLDEAGAPVTRDFEGLWATSVQHQIDHLDGRVFLDRLSPLRRCMAMKRAAKRQE